MVNNYNYLLIMTEDGDTAYVGVDEITMDSTYEINGERRITHTLQIEGNVSSVTLPSGKNSYDFIIDIMRSMREHEAILVCGGETVHYPTSCLKNISVSCEPINPGFISSNPVWLTKRGRLWTDVTLQINTESERKLNHEQFNALTAGMGLRAWNAARIALTNGPELG